LFLFLFCYSDYIIYFNNIHIQLIHSYYLDHKRLQKGLWRNKLSPTSKGESSGIQLLTAGVLWNGAHSMRAPDESPDGSPYCLNYDYYYFNNSSIILCRRTCAVTNKYIISFFICMCIVPRLKLIFTTEQIDSCWFEIDRPRLENSLQGYSFNAQLVPFESFRKEQCSVKHSRELPGPKILLLVILSYIQIINIILSLDTNVNLINIYVYCVKGNNLIFFFLMIFQGLIEQ